MRLVYARWLLVLVLLVGLEGCAALDIREPQVEVIETRFQGLSVTTGLLESRLRVHNPNPVGLPVKKLSYQLLLNDVQFSSGELDQDLKLGANQSREITLPVEIDYRQLVGGISNIITNRKFQFRLRGELDFGLVRVPYRKTGEFSLR